MRCVAPMDVVLCLKLIEKDVDNPVIHDSISFFSKHAEIVENGTISKALKNLLISGENI